MVGIYDFHVSILRKHVWEEDRVAIVNLLGLDIWSYDSILVDLVRIVEILKNHTINKVTNNVKLQWSENKHDDTRVIEDDMCINYPHLFESLEKIQLKNSL